MTSAFRNIVLVAVFFFTVAGFFQNCTQAVTNGGTETQFSGNGEGYGGKARYENSPAVCSGGSSAILREGRKFSLVRRDCADLTPPQPLAEGQVEYLPHSKNTAVFEGKVYQVPGSIPPSAGLTQDVHRFCRVNRLDTAGTGEVVDAYILRASDGSFRARANVGSYIYYNVGAPILDRTVAAANPGAESYSGTGLPAGEFFQLDITLPGVTPLNFNLSGVYRSELVTCYSY